MIPALHSAYLDFPGLSHAFFTRQGGVSGGVYASLNGGVGSRDAAANVVENRRRMAVSLGVAPERLLVPFQIHSSLALAVAAPWAADDRPHVDGIATATPGLGIGVTGADCGTVLFADPQARVVGACHAGWKGALGGVVEATVAAMTELGATPAAVVAVIGPTIAQDSYEVGPEFVDRFTDADETNRRFFVDSAEGRSRFDLPGFIAARCRAAGVGQVQDLGLDTYADEERFFSYRRGTHRGDPDYGRLVAAIAVR